MTTWIVFLRGVNVGGNNKLPMQSLRGSLENAGFENVRTYIQSGNIVLESRSRSKKAIERLVSATIETDFQLDLDMSVMAIADLRAALSNDPFSEAAEKPNTLHYFFLSARPRKPGLEKATSMLSTTEQCELRDDVFYLFAPDGIARSKVAANAERYLGVGATARNLRTVTKVLELAN